MEHKSNFFSSSNLNDFDYPDVDPTRDINPPADNPVKVDSHNESKESNSCELRSLVSAQALRSWNAFQEKYATRIPFLNNKKEST